MSLRAASSAASFTRLARSAPAKPAVRAATTLQVDVGRRASRCLVWMRSTSSRPFTSGLSTSTWRSKRPGRSRAGSSTSGRLVAAMMMIALRESKPSISASSWLSVCSRSSCDPIGLCTRARPSASSSSMKMMHGAFCFGLREQIAHARRADADEHLDELRSAQAEEGHLGLAGDGAREQRLAGSRRADQQHALRNASAERRCTSSGSSGTRRSPSAPARPRPRPPHPRSSPSRRLRRRRDACCAQTTSRRLRRRPCGGRRSSRCRREAGAASIQPRSSGSQRLTNSPVYFTPAASRSSSSFGSSMRVGVEVACCRWRRACTCRGSSVRRRRPRRPGPRGPPA